MGSAGTFMEFSAGFATADPKSANPARNPRPGAESSDSTPKAYTGARSAPVGAAEGRAYAFGVESDDSAPGRGLRGGFC